MPAVPPTPSATERAYSTVKRDVLSGRMPGGTMTSEGEVAEDLGVSRTPVREAFLRLQAEGYLTLYPKRGALVVPVAPGEADDILEARALVEGHAAQRITALPAAERAAFIDKLRTLVERQRTALAGGDVAAYVQADSQFHLEITSAGGNPILAHFAGTLRERQQRVTAHSLADDMGRAGSFIDGHARLIDCLQRRDADAYAEELTTHFHEVRGQIR